MYEYNRWKRNFESHRTRQIWNIAGTVWLSLFIGSKWKEGCIYSKTPHQDHLEIKTTPLMRPLFQSLNSFAQFSTRILRPPLYKDHLNPVPVVVFIARFHCTRTCYYSNYKMLYLSRTLKMRCLCLAAARKYNPVHSISANLKNIAIWKPLSTIILLIFV
jgi:hypothetical protein